LEVPFTLRWSEGPNGCQCHYDIEGISNSEAKNIYERLETKDELDIYICEEDGTDRSVCFEADHCTLIRKLIR
jgi:hypothetical protein